VESRLEQSSSKQWKRRKLSRRSRTDDVVDTFDWYNFLFRVVFQISVIPFSNNVWEWDRGVTRFSVVADVFSIETLLP